ncbi:YggS family pyridoxal phosphate-dependent enzyme [Arachidicoccus ginsenosidivorans]|uniref:Pyridoxal phosphate homeostasis protein n=1 Tax=Arachidicoccus ginsenosidivorans TaxID=496057 RepID=A0A5B8VSM4_9BACT|nr:YggS family pyridoxal phosphate-dependent enzyme [Arachidicoccus ginsenosidivorans]QEC73595.1 YggS family pyridoxal phosphate-dependent enzyme [Arachidicoccus ginsenosidivorans]
MEEGLQHNIEKIRRRIDTACKNSSRKPTDVKLLLATKTVSADRIKAAITAGCRLIAENKIQEVKEKFNDLQEVAHESHFIGHLQTNKVKELLKYNITCLHSLDRLELGEKLQHRLVLENKYLDVLIQVNTSGEVSKFGVPPDQAIMLVQKIACLDRLRIKGLMTIGLFSADAAKVRPCFQLLSQLKDQIAGLNITGVQMQELSMGMSSDLEVAIEEGATIVRVGTAVFGKRQYPDSFYWNESKGR